MPTISFGRRPPPSVYLLFAICLALVACGTPKLTQECRMNGFGKGACTFTNTGSAGGTVCGHVMVKRLAPAVDYQYVSSKGEYGRDDAESAYLFQARKDYSQSSVFCSGEVGSKETKSVDFGVSDVDSLCAGQAAWSQNCVFVFVSEEEAKDALKL